MTTPILAITEIVELQKQPSVTANESTRTLEFFASGVVQSIGDTAPPGSPVDGEGYILGASPTGDWSTFDEHDVVYYRSDAWVQLVPSEGWRFYVADLNDTYIFDSTEWIEVIPVAPTFTVAGVPDASDSQAGGMIFVSDETGGAVLAFSDGTDWRRVTDRAVVS